MSRRCTSNDTGRAGTAGCWPRLESLEARQLLSGVSFLAAVNRGAGAYVWDVAVGDFNRDSKADLAAANSFGATKRPRFNSKS